MRFGKHPPIKDYRSLLLKDYFVSDLPDPPEAFDILPTVMKETGYHDAATLFPIDGNDQYGCCTIAALAHAITVYNAMIGLRQIWSRDDVVKVYFKLSGGSDTGLSELDVLNYWRKRYRDKILAYVSIDPKNHDHVKLAIQLFGGCYIGFQVPENCMHEFNSGQPWTPGRLTNDGHAVYVTAYNDNGISCLTWGALQYATWEWWDECVDEAYAILPIQASNDNFNKTLKLAQLQEDLNKIAD